MALAKFMAGPVGRGARVVLGVVLIVLGLAVVGDTAGLILAAVGVVPILAGVFNVCLIGPIIGAPLSGKDLA
ncbi:YgaP-like transmembrane domain [Aggregatilineales bacterium SYSU G02658]